MESAILDAELEGLLVFEQVETDVMEDGEVVR